MFEGFFDFLDPYKPPDHHWLVTPAEAALMRADMLREAHEFADEQIRLIEREGK